jgi:hypothetical protein
VHGVLNLRLKFPQFTISSLRYFLCQDFIIHVDFVLIEFLGLLHVAFRLFCGVKEAFFKFLYKLIFYVINFLYQQFFLAGESEGLYTEGRIFHCELWKHFYRYTPIHPQAYRVYQNSYTAPAQNVLTYVGTWSVTPAEFEHFRAPLSYRKLVCPFINFIYGLFDDAVNISEYIL